MAGAGDKNALEQMKRATNIDRRSCKRVVPLEVLCFGLSRTGTLSLREALRQLGYQDTYHYSSCSLENPRDCEMWVDAMKAKFEGKGSPFGRKDWDQLLGHCMAITDSPVVFFWEDLLAAYPEAKVILTTRDVDAYYRSFMRTLQPWGEKYSIPSSNPFRRIYQMLVPKNSFGEMNRMLYKYGHGLDFPETGKVRYLNHNEAVRQTVPKERLLEFDVTKHGWEPLCKFLGKPIPPTPFPHVNDAGTFLEYWSPVDKMLDSIVMVQAAKMIGTVVVAIGLGYFGWQQWTIRR